MKRITIPAIAILLCTACSNVEEPKRPEPLVIEGHIGLGEFPEVLLTQSLAPPAAGDDVELSDAVLRWGKVTVSDGERTVILTGGSERDELPPYRYYSQELRGEPGRTYTVTASYGARAATAVCSMPSAEPTDIAALTADRGSLTAHFTAPQECPAYFCLFARTTPTGRMLPCAFGCVKTVDPGADMSVQVLRPYRLDEEYSPEFASGEQVWVQLVRVTPEVFEFWSAFSNFVTFGQSPFLSSQQSLPGNVEGGRGVWSAQVPSHVSHISIP